MIRRLLTNLAIVAIWALIVVPLIAYHLLQGRIFARLSGLSSE